MSDEDAFNIPDDLKDDNEDEAETYFRSLGEFMNWLAGAWDHKIDYHTRRWCRQWWKHPEAFARCTALWRSFEEARLSPSGMSVWWLDHLDRHMSELTSPSGPFRDCEAGQHNKERALDRSTRVQLDTPPAALWPHAAD